MIIQDVNMQAECATAGAPRPGHMDGTAIDHVAARRRKPVSARHGALQRGVARQVGSAMERTSWAGCRRLGGCLGLAFFAAGRRRRELAIKNVQMALGYSRAGSTRIARRSAQNWGMTSCEFLHQPGASAAEIEAYVHLTGVEHLRAALQEGLGVILLMAHLGNWEVLAARLAQEFQVGAIVRPLSNAAVQEHMSGIRRGHGITLISKQGAARPALQFLQRQGLLCILPDRHAGAEGALLPLFDRPTRFETAPARLAVLSGAPVVPIFGVRREPWLCDGRIEGRIFPAFRVPCEGRAARGAAVLDGTRQVIASIEYIVRERPDQWSWMLRRWRADDAAVPAPV